MKVYLKFSNITFYVFVFDLWKYEIFLLLNITFMCLLVVVKYLKVLDKCICYISSLITEICIYGYLCIKMIIVVFCYINDIMSLMCCNIDIYDLFLGCI
jgi:hypothetical protein